MTTTEDLIVTIEVDATQAMEAFTRAIEAATRAIAAFVPYGRWFRLDAQRHRSRVVTRNKQRRNW